MLFTIFKNSFVPEIFKFSTYANYDVIRLNFVMMKKDISVSEMFDSLQYDSIKCAPQHELNSFVTMAKKS